MSKAIVRKPLSILLSLLMVLSVFGGVLFTAAATQEDLEAFAAYKTVKKAEAQNLAADGDSEACQSLVTNAVARIDALPYDDSKSLDDNKAEVDKIVTLLDADLYFQREDERIAAEVQAQIDAIGDVDYSAEAQARIEAAAQAYAQLTDEQKALVTNAAKLENAKTAYAQLQTAYNEKVAASKERLRSGIAAGRAFYNTIKNIPLLAQVADDLDTRLQRAEALLNSEAPTLDDLNSYIELVTSALEVAKEQKKEIDVPEYEEPTAEDGICPLCGNAAHGDNRLASILCAVVYLVRVMIVNIIPGILNMI